MGYLTDEQNYDPAENVYDEIKPNSFQPKKTHKVYYSNIDGGYILDAVTGAKYPWKVGSFDEQRFFRYIDVTGRNGTYTQKAFFENPCAFMKHMKHNNLDLGEDYIQEWYNNINKLYPGQYSHPSNT